MMRKPPGKTQPFLLGMAIGLLLGVLILDVVLPTGVVGGVVYVGVVLLSLASERRTLTFLTAFAFTCLVAYDHLAFLQEPELMPWSMVARLGLIVTAIWVPFLAALAAKQVQDYVEYVNTPLHLCPSCKKIRDDKGAWVKPDEFIKQETGREAVAGMCPGCRAKWTAGRPAYTHV